MIRLNQKRKFLKCDVVPFQLLCLFPPSIGPMINFGKDGAAPATPLCIKATRMF